MVEVSSRPSSIRDIVSDDGGGSESETSGTDDASEGEDFEADRNPRSDARSVRSFSSMMSSASKERDKATRKSLSDRLANVSGLSTKFPRSPPRESPIRVSGYGCSKQDDY